jgi:3-oxoacyl-[acyl-carrier protein] reductase
MDLQLKDKTILVTAASRGLGLGTAEALVQEGAKVIICGRTEDTLKAAVAKLGEYARYVVADVSTMEGVKHLIANIKEHEGMLDGMFVNAGGPSPGKFSDLSEADWERAFQLTLMSTVRLTREAIPLLSKSESPSILYNTSISVKQPIGNLLLSNSMRPAVIGMMRTFAEESEGRIRVNAVCPGYINTERVKELMDASGEPDQSRERITSNIPLGRMGEPAEFGAVCTFLLSPVASYIHGALLLVDGGLYKGMM